ncbi:hypothetical protein M8J77_008939 [Diaphorina citri]|nr:hypothetical protein M8J77_008939 [Diaphorina citri]
MSKVGYPRAKDYRLEIFFMVSTTVQTILDNLTSLDNWTLAIGAAENASLLNLTNSSFVPKINGFDDGPQFPAYIRTPSMVLCSIILCIGVLGNIVVPCVSSLFCSLPIDPP